MRPMYRSILASLIVAGAAWVGPAIAQTYPSRAVKIVVPYPPGGYTDVLARMLAAGLQARLGQPFVVDNKPGAATAIAAEHVAASAPDGHTLLMTTVTTLAMNPLTIKDLRYRVDQFVPIALVARQPFMLVASKQFAPGTPQELIAYAKANPGKINWATQGLAGSSQLVGELFKSLTGIDIVAIHYKGSAPANIDLIGGRVDIHFDGVGTSLRNVENDRVKAIAITAEKRLAVAPGIPTFVESGVPGMVAYSWYGIVAPAATPTSVVDQLNKEIVAWSHGSEIGARMVKDGSEVSDMSPKQFGQMIADEAALWRKVIEPLNLKLE